MVVGDEEDDEPEDPGGAPKPHTQKLRSRFHVVKKLGQGTYGKVQLAINRQTGEQVAIKTIKKVKIETPQDLVRIQREIQIMSSVQHPHIIHIYEVFENREKIVLVMEYASGGELYDYLSFRKVLCEEEARRLFRQIASAVYYCHKNKICHRDLKLENILLDENGNAKIADFGLSNVFDEKNFLTTFCGSPLYASPEIVKGTPYCGPEVDCWSLGVLLYTLVYGAMPFDGSNFRKLVKQISDGDYYEPRQASAASHLIRAMLTVEPGKRAGVDEICSDWWVDVGYEEPLLSIAQQMCQQLPVRLDYLLAITGTATTGSFQLPSEQPADDVGAIPAPTLEVEGLPSGVEPSDIRLFVASTESCSMNSLPDATAPVMDIGGEQQLHPDTADRKHKLASSSCELSPAAGDRQLNRKKVRKADSAAGINGAPNEAGINGAPNEASINGAPNEASINGVPSEASINGVPSEASINGAPSKDVLKDTETETEPAPVVIETTTGPPEVETPPAAETEAPKKKKIIRKVIRKVKKPKVETAVATTGSGEDIPTRKSDCESGIETSQGEGKETDTLTEAKPEEETGGQLMEPVAVDQETTQEERKPAPAKILSMRNKFEGIPSVNSQSKSRIATAPSTRVVKSQSGAGAKPAAGSAEQRPKDTGAPEQRPKDSGAVAKPAAGAVEQRPKESGAVAKPAAEQRPKESGAVAKPAAAAAEQRPKDSGTVAGATEQRSKDNGAAAKSVEQRLKDNVAATKPVAGATEQRPKDSGAPAKPAIAVAEQRAKDSGAAAKPVAGPVEQKPSAADKTTGTKPVGRFSFAKPSENEGKLPVPVKVSPPVTGGKDKPSWKWSPRPTSPEKAVKRTESIEKGKKEASPEKGKIQEAVKKQGSPAKAVNPVAKSPEKTTRASPPRRSSLSLVRKNSMTTSPNIRKISSAPESGVKGKDANEFPLASKTTEKNISKLPSKVVMNGIKRTPAGRTASNDRKTQVREPSASREEKTEAVASKDIAGTESSFLSRIVTDLGSVKVEAAAPEEPKPKQQSTLHVMLSSGPELRSASGVEPRTVPESRPAAASEPRSTPGPAIRFVPPSESQFHLLGVKSEVSFSVGADEGLPPTPPTKKPIARRPSEEETEKPITDVYTECTVPLNKAVSPPGDAGYSVYRSKFKTVKNFSVSAPEPRPAAPRREASLDRSDSFSSTGSNDDFEDAFENMTSESLFMSLLNRTRTLIDCMARESPYSSQFRNLVNRSSLFGSSTSSWFDSGSFPHWSVNGHKTGDTTEPRTSRYDSFSRQKPISETNNVSANHLRMSRFDKFVGSEKPRATNGSRASSVFSSGLMRPSAPTIRPTVTVTQRNLSLDRRSKESQETSSESQFNDDVSDEMRSQPDISIYGTIRRPVRKISQDSSCNGESLRSRPRSFFGMSELPRAAQKPLDSGREYSRQYTTTRTGHELQETERVQQGGTSLVSQLEETLSRDDDGTSKLMRFATHKRVSQRDPRMGKNSSSYVMKTFRQCSSETKSSESGSEATPSASRRSSMSRQDSGIDSMPVATAYSRGSQTPSRTHSDDCTARSQSDTERANDVSNWVNDCQGDETDDAGARSDSVESSSACSDVPGTWNEEESVGERIRRKSYFARFNDSRIPRKCRRFVGGSESDVESGPSTLTGDEPHGLSRQSSYSGTSSLGATSLRRNSFSKPCNAASDTQLPEVNPIDSILSGDGMSSLRRRSSFSNSSLRMPRSGNPISLSGEPIHRSCSLNENYSSGLSSVRRQSSIPDEPGLSAVKARDRIITRLNRMRPILDGAETAPSPDPTNRDWRSSPLTYAYHPPPSSLRSRHDAMFQRLLDDTPSSLSDFGYPPPPRLPVDPFGRSFHSSSLFDSPDSLRDPREAIRRAMDLGNFMKF